MRTESDMEHKGEPSVTGKHELENWKRKKEIKNT
jgi:hypothetical protein